MSITLTLLALAQPAQASATLQVPQDYESLQDAVWAAVSGDTIEVDPYGVHRTSGEPFRPGSVGWTDYVLVDRDLEIVSASETTLAQLPALKVHGSEPIDVLISNVQIYGFYDHRVQLEPDEPWVTLNAALYVSGGALLRGQGQVILNARSEDAYFEAGLVVVDAQADIGGLKVSGLTAFRGAYLLSEGGTARLTLRDFEFADNAAGGVYADGALPGFDAGEAVLTLESGLFRGNEATEGGGLWLRDLGSVSLSSVNFYANFADVGGAMLAEDVRIGSALNLSVRGDDPDSGAQAEASEEGAGLALWSSGASTWTLQDSEFENLETVGWGGSAVAARGVDVAIKGGEGRSLTAPAGAFVRIQSADFVAELVDITSYQIGNGEGGAFHFDEVGRNNSFTLRHVLVCGGGGPEASGALALVSEDSDVVVEWSVFQNNARETVPLIRIVGGRAALLHNSLVNNDSSALLDAPAAELLLYNNIFSGRALGSGVGVQGTAESSISAGWNLWADFPGGLTSGGDYALPGEGAVTSGPELWAGYDPADCDSRPYLSAISPAIDAGTSMAELGLDEDWLLDITMHAEDVDGSAPDMGAYGGLAAEQPPDEDGDGYAQGVDCDDTDPQVHPGAGDVPGDGVDADCDGEDNAAASSGTLYALIGGCSSAPRGGAWGLGLAALLLGLRRRR